MKTVATLTSHVIRLNDPAPAPVTLDDWFCVRTHRTTFRTCTGEWSVELHLPPVAKRFTVTPLDGGDPRHLDTLLEVAALLRPGTATSPDAQPEEIHGTITNHPWRYVADDEVARLCELALMGEVSDACGHKLPPDLTPLEARLCILSDFPGYCLLGIAQMQAHRLQPDDGEVARVDPSAIIPNPSRGKPDRGWGNGGGYSGHHTSPWAGSDHS